LRYPVQVIVGVGGLVVALGLVAGLAGTEDVVAQGSVVVDGPTLFIQGTVLGLALLSLLLFAESRADPGGATFAPAASTVPGSPHERQLAALGRRQTEVYPLAMFA